MGGTIRLFKFSGIQVYLHFSWFLVAAYQFTRRADLYTSPIWAAAEYVALFAIVLLHEFGHIWAGRVFGSDGYIVLYSFGGLAVHANDVRRRWQRVVISLAGPLSQIAYFPASRWLG